MIRFSLRNQKKIEDALGKDFLKWLLLSLKEYFNKGVEPTEYQYDNDNTGYKIIHIDNVQPHTDSYFELYIIKKTYGVYNLAYKSCAG
jgi:hypothetical protein